MATYHGHLIAIQAAQRMKKRICKVDYEAYVTIRSSDTDVAVIMLSNMSA